MYRSGPPIGDTLVALADPTRRAMVELLAERPRRVGELVDAFPVSQPAISPLAGLLDQVRRFWADHLEQFRTYAGGSAPHDPPKTTMEEL